MRLASTFVYVWLGSSTGSNKAQTEERGRGSEVCAYGEWSCSVKADGDVENHNWNHRWW